MISLLRLRGWADDARAHDDTDLAELLGEIAEARATAVREALGGDWWLSTADVPEGVMFRPAVESAPLTYMKVDGRCLALPPEGSGSSYSTTHIDSVWRDAAGFVEAQS